MAYQGKQLINDPTEPGSIDCFVTSPTKTKRPSKRRSSERLHLLLFQMRPFLRHPGAFSLLLRGARPVAPHSVALLRNFSLPRFAPRPDRLLIPRAAAAFSASSGASASATASKDRSSRNTLVYLLGLVAAMVGASYAAVPLYRRFCQATGYGGTVQRREFKMLSGIMNRSWLVTRNESLQSVEEKIARHAQEGTKTSRSDPSFYRDLVVQFNADVADGMPWKFTPTQREVRVKPGESALAFYTAENRSSTPITGVSTYNVTPMKAAVYFNKIQCFCFEEQRLLPGEQIDMPVFFYIDPEFETDPKMDGINNIILSYTFFKVNED
ncbi:cytochrome c oxidase assembly protein [Musa troglodytarum]|uniref:Cytochrome c oxidase assembly protein n=1 Tax=Musa troglodytarum TaxID=320322 RepID=A0A9E7JM43_9LILI|nr:cytochrome c oxidase assembly protein [Musa troglodytarum]